MGMFDYVTSELSLPDGFTGTLQTKDFGCAFMHFLIRTDGRLMENVTEFVAVPKRERLPTTSRLEALRGSYRIVDLGWRDTAFHGDICLTGYDEGAKEQHFYVARFTHGTLEWIKAFGASELMPRR